MKILLVQESDWIDRLPISHHHLMERVALKGHKVHVIDHDLLWRSSGKRGFQKGFMRDVTKIYPKAKVRVRRPSNVQIPYIEYLFMPLFQRLALRKELNTFEPDIVICFGLVNASIAIGMAKGRDIPSVYYIIDHLHTLIPEKPLRNIGARIERGNILRCDHLFANNQGLVDYARELSGKEIKASIFPSGVDIAGYKTRKGRVTRSELGIPDNATVFVFMGFLYKFSGMYEFCRTLAKDRHGAHVLIVGDGDDLPRLKGLAAKHDWIHLTGRVDVEIIPDHLQIADVGLLPALKHPTMENIVPIKIYEYLAAGLPVVASDLPGLRKEFGNGNGVYYTNGPAKAVAKAFEVVGKNQNASEFILKYSWDTITDKFEQKLENIVRKGKK